jgi:thioredoxin reductase (NADPH)
VENYPGFVRLSGYDLMQEFKKHVEDYKDKVELLDASALHAKKTKNGFEIETSEGKVSARAVILATGTERRKLGVPGEKEYANKGVSYCATCDAPLFKGKVVGIVGGSDSAVKEGLLLSEYASKVYVIYRGNELRAEPINMERMKKAKNMEVITQTNVVEVKGEKFITHAILDKPFQGKKEMPLGGLFIEIGHIVRNELAKELGVACDEKGELVIDKNSNTNVPGVFAAGDVTNRAWKQLITGVAEGCVAAWSAYEFLNGNSTREK